MSFEISTLADYFLLISIISFLVAMIIIMPTIKEIYKDFFFTERNSKKELKFKKKQRKLITVQNKCKSLCRFLSKQNHYAIYKH